MISILDVMTCDDSGTVETILIIKNVLTLIKYVVPIILVIMCSIEILKTVASDKVDNKKMSSSLIKKLVAAAIIFFIPSIVNFIMGIAEGIELTNNDCWSRASSEYVTQLKNQEKEEIKEKQEEFEKEQKSKFEQLIEDAKKIILKEKKEETSTNTDYDKASVIDEDWELFYQFNDAWGNKKICNSSDTLSSAGCGYTSFAMIATHFNNKSITPPTVTDWICNNTNEDGNAINDDTLYNSTLMNHYNIKANVLFYRGNSLSESEKKKKVENSLKNGNPVIVLVPGHYIVLAQMNGNSVLLYTSGTGGEKSGGEQSGWYSSIDAAYNALMDHRNTCGVGGECGWLYAISYSKK